MEQVRAFNARNAGTKAGWCLRNVRMGYGIDPVYASAWDAWNGTPQKRNRTIPTGVDVPLYYDYTDRAGNRYGHINVRLKDGRIWNDGNYFANLSTFERAWPNVKYVGWSTHVNNVQVIKENNVKPTKANVNRIYRIGGYGKNAPASDQNHWVNRPLDNLLEAVWNSTWNDRTRRRAIDYPKLESDLKQATDSLSKQRKYNEQATAQLAEKIEEVGMLQDDVDNLKNDKKQLEAEIKQFDKEIVKLEKENKRLQDEVKSQDGTLTALGHLRMAIRKALHLQ